MNREQLERDILAAIIGNPKAFFEHKKALPIAFFVNPIHRRIMEGISGCVEAGVDIDLVNIATVGKLKPEEIALLSELQPSLYGDLGVLAKALAEEVIREKFIAWRDKITLDADVFELLAQVEAIQNEAAEIVAANSRKDKLDLLREFCEYVLTNSEKGVQRIPTPFPTLSRMLKGGFEPGGFTLLGGTPGSGKTSFMLSLALYAAKTGVKTSFIEGEMPANEIFERCNGIQAGVDIAEVRNGARYSELTKQFVSDFYGLPLEIVPLYDRTLDALVSEIRRQVYNGAKFVFVDYLQVFTPKMKSSDEFFEIKKTSENLRGLALQNGVHLFVATSLNRSERQAERLTLNSFYGSSGLGHDCSVGMILSGEQSDWEEYVNPERTVLLHVVKNRSGPRGEIALKFYLSSQRFEELTEVSERDGVFEERDNGEHGF